MHSLLQIALINAVVIVPLAAIAFGVGRLSQRPALAHLLWVLILVKLLTPPVCQIPMVDRVWLQSTTLQLLPNLLTASERVTEPAPLGELNRLNPGLASLAEDESKVAVKGARPRTLAGQDKAAALRNDSVLLIIAEWVRSEVFPQAATATVVIIWALGALTWFVIQGIRCVRFRWSLAHGSAAPPELQQLSDRLAHRMGLSKSPVVWLMPRIMSPMLWGNGDVNLLIFPERLLDRLDQESTETLLTHELAHYCRRDHWVRVAALMATGFYWWHPVVWWARREIEAVEEECCDALVLKSVTSPPKRYAEAILEAIDFLTETPSRLPPLATGLSQFPFLRQRLTWIMRGPRKQDFGHAGKVLCLILACSLPLQPTWLAAHLPSRTPPISTVEQPGASPSPDMHSPDSGTGSDVFGDVASISASTPQDASLFSSKWTGLDVRSHSHDRRFILLGNKSTQILLDMESGQEFDLSPFDIVSIAFSPNSNQFATIDGDRFLRLWDAENCDVIQTWQIPGGPAKSVDISANGRWIVTGGRDGIVRIWSVASQRPFRELPRELSSVNCVRFSPDGEMLAVATGDWNAPQTGRIALIDVGSWDERISMNWNSPAAAVAFRADGLSLTSGDWQGRIARWSTATGELLGLTSGQMELLSLAEFSPNGSVLAEIEVPELQDTRMWKDVTPNEQFEWLLNSLSVIIPGSTAAPSKLKAANP
ncbi:M56 family metallopeptidase [Schlesneria paludicola]|uniref:M56 family metallopeptidase n=1 Tax=Schlesneria paludicola TaxID=360056 RepID=UPI00029B256C|nr:M56 family metallopeptidase [Schlesneria paludicola]